MRVDDRGRGPIRRGVARAHQERGDGEPVERLECDVLELGVRAFLTDSGAGAWTEAGWLAGREPPELRRRRVIVVGRHHVAAGRPLRDIPDPAGRELGGAPVRRVDRHEAEAVALAARGHDAAAVWMPGVLRVVSSGARELPVVRSVRIHQVQLVEAAPLRRVGDPRAVGRPARAAVVHVRFAGEAAHLAGLDARHADLAAPVLVRAGRERVGHSRAVGGHVGVALVAVRVQVAVAGGEPARQRIVDVHDGEPGGSVLVVLHLDQQAAVADPQRAPALDEPARRAARRRHQPDVLTVDVGHRVPARRKPRGRVLPIRHRVAAGRQASRR